MEPLPLPTVTQRDITRAELAELVKNQTAVHRPVSRNSNFLEIRDAIAQTKNIPGTLPIAFIEGVGISAPDANHRINAALETPYDTFRATVADHGKVSVFDFARLHQAYNWDIKKHTSGDKIRPQIVLDVGLSEFMAKHSWLNASLERKKSQIPITTFLSSARASVKETPVTSPHKAETQLEGLDWLEGFTSLCEESWDLKFADNRPFYGQLNLTLVMWLYLRIIRDVEIPGTVERRPKVTTVTRQEFKACMQALAGGDGGHYLGWLGARSWSESNRRHAYNRIKDIFAVKLKDLGTHKSIALPQPEWSRASRALKKFKPSRTVAGNDGE